MLQQSKLDLINVLAPLLLQGCDARKADLVLGEAVMLGRLLDRLLGCSTACYGGSRAFVRLPQENNMVTFKN